ncbi:type II toxin-antitoxin system VapC family toxin [Geoalkalibacter halelectricus]|uniref:Type II toxin-antitoxin system VapC family toxin n=1 Tax=Geoalkalibacter halelectricus TaxID=2847045 RepID=A0ABY5ZMU9_9BACT|nr:type II toxin-antitoxin system VapC family toxin [Geoalkalibacter halelectricus]MDO3378734.1 type II toxin-antitoxin system VapC family toxin [Geoalkalibacter halelectricus]UWZ79958.1 type II toxin-antitoxin system VapC family toxin [Geoalkalibacter halelectricus]
MIALDTNILVRYAVKDDRRQTALATRFLAEHRCFILKSVLLECAWVLSSPSGYNLPRVIVHERLLHILGLPNIEMEDAVHVAQALAWYAEGMDFADALHLCGATNLEGIATFDRKFSSAVEKGECVPPVILLR